MLLYTSLTTVQTGNHHGGYTVHAIYAQITALINHVLAASRT
jgi:hypothetical protein